MMNIKKIVALTLGICLTTLVFAARPNWKSIDNTQIASSKAMACAPATELVLMNFNNVRALIETGGSMWQDRATGNAFYRVPAEGNLSVIFAGALWLGGISPDQQLKMAAVTFRADGNDFWPGPLTIDGAAEIDEETCTEYDEFYLTERSWAEEHRAYYDCINDDGCDENKIWPNGYIIPAEFVDYPAHGNPELNQDFYLAPFFDYAAPNETPDGLYDPESGDYPWYDLNQEVDCASKSREDTIPLFGDQNYWWIFNDKGNVHSESNGEPIGMEIRAQAFSFATNDEVNNMTFYNYVMINRGTTELGETYFGQWVDADIGNFGDDYVGCDVQRGLGFAYNGDNDDEGIQGYGLNPPAIGVDFFEGPYQDYDQIDNPGPATTLEPLDYQEAVDGRGIPYKGLGIGYGDGIPDNERFGMRKFLYYNNSTGQNGDPQIAAEYYNYLIGIWRNGLPMTYGGDGFTTDNDPNQLTDFMFPGESDVVGFGTGGNIQEPWDESVTPADRRFIQSAGPFSLLPGDYNNITVGVVYGRSFTGDPTASIDVMKAADDKAQALFDNCFEIVSGPDAPDIATQELDREVILMLSNTRGNNKDEGFGPTNGNGFDPGIPELNADNELRTVAERSYEFQGYQVYQLADASVTVADLDDINFAIEILTMDKEDDIDVAINNPFDEILGATPVLEALGPNVGIQHSLSITGDAFNGGEDLINYKTYYFMVTAYAYNEYEEYDSVAGTGQDETYKSSRKSGNGGEVQVIAVIPHPVTSESNGTVLSANYGDGIPVTRIEGKGNGNVIIDLDPSMEEQIMSGEPWRVDETLYAAGAAPIEVKVIDPLAVQDGSFQLAVANDEDQDLEQGDGARWILVNLDTQDTTFSDQSIDVLNEQLFLDQGISITIRQFESQEPDEDFRAPLEATIEFADPALPWLIGYPDQEGFTEANWIRSGTLEAIDPPDQEDSYDDYTLDITEEFEGLLGGTVAPYSLVSFSEEATAGGSLINVAPAAKAFSSGSSLFSSKIDLTGVNNVDIVLTSDKSKWTRCPVLEMQANENLVQSEPGFTYQSEGEKATTRLHPSVDKNGRSSGDSGYNQAEGELHGQTEGMGWFPGYAIDQDTGERLNMAFGEDSWLGSENGRDMLWNPTGNTTNGLFGPSQVIYAGGQHWVYVFRNAMAAENDDDLCPGYDEGRYLYANLAQDDNRADVFESCSWVASGLLTPGFSMTSVEEGLIPTETRLRLRIARDYQRFSASGLDFRDPDTYPLSENFWNPLYTFETNSSAVRQGLEDVLTESLENINVVPNPYYAFSQYEESKLDNRVKITNLPFECEISIYNLSGSLVRFFNKADPVTFLDWDLKNNRNIPIASGTYIIHIKTPEGGEKILKWFGVMRPVDLDNF